MVDRGHARVRCIQRARLACGVDGHALAHARGFLDGSGQFLFRVLVWRGQAAIHQRVLAGFVDFGEVGAFLILLAHGFHKFCKALLA